MSRHGLLVLTLLAAHGCGREDAQPIAREEPTVASSPARDTEEAPSTEPQEEPSAEPRREEGPKTSPEPAGPHRASSPHPQDEPELRAAKVEAVKAEQVSAEPAWPGAKRFSSEGLVLSASVGGDGETETEVRFEVSNTSDRAVYLFTPLQRYDFKAQEWHPSPERFYTTLDDDDILRFSKRLADLPTEYSVLYVEVPYLTRLRPGERYTESHTLKAPLTLDTAYVGRSTDETGNFLLSRGVAVEIGFFREGDAPVKAVKSPGLYSVEYADGIAAQRLLTVEFAQLVRVYK